MNKGSLSGNAFQSLYDPANATATFSTDVLNMARYNHASIAVQLGTVAANGFTMTVEYCDDNTPTTDTIMAFNYRTKSATSESYSALTAATSAGVAITTSHSNYILLIELDAIELAVASSDADCRVLLKFTDAASGDIYVSVLAVLSEPRYPGLNPAYCLD
jgi:ribulose bisphosphate carboxylase small subunit